MDSKFSKYMSYLRQADRELISSRNDPGLTTREDWIQLVTPGAPTHYRNGIYHSQIEKEPGLVIDQTIQFYREKGLPFRWVISVDTLPTSLPDLLLKRGFQFFERSIGMVIDIEKYSYASGEALPVDRIEERDVEKWCQLICSAWEIPNAGHEQILKDTQNAFGDTQVENRFYWALIDSIPVGGATLTIMGDYAIFSGAAVLSGHRGKGAYRALLDRRIKDLEERGIEVVVNFCREKTSAPICRRLGFIDVCHYDHYIFEDV